MFPNTSTLPWQHLIGDETPDPSSDAGRVLSLVTCGRVVIKVFLSFSVVRVVHAHTACTHRLLSTVTGPTR